MNPQQRIVAEKSTLTILSLLHKGGGYDNFTGTIGRLSTDCGTL